jgi:hypothetical protein
MADSAVKPDMASAITAIVGDLQKVIQLPSGWLGTFSIRMDAASASVLVRWKPADQVGSIRPPDKKKRKRSKASVKRSADRAQAHRIRKEQQLASSQQRPWLDPNSPPFIPNSAGADGNPQLGCVQDSGRKRPTTFRPESSESSPKNRAVIVSGPPPPPPRPRLGFVKEGGLWVKFGDQKFWDQVQRSINVNSEAVNVAIGRMSEGVGVVWDQAEAIAALQALDSLTQCPGFGAKTWDDLVNRSRRGQIGAD